MGNLVRQQIPWAISSAAEASRRKSVYVPRVYMRQNPLSISNSCIKLTPTRGGCGAVAAVSDRRETGAQYARPPKPSGMPAYRPLPGRCVRRNIRRSETAAVKGSPVGLAITPCFSEASQLKGRPRLLVGENDFHVGLALARCHFTGIFAGTDGAPQAAALQAPPCH